MVDTLENRTMKKEKLKPYVHKVKGASKYALYDILYGNFYQLSPEGDVDQLRKSLKEAGLVFETRGVVPFKVEIDLYRELNSLNIRELQVRLNGRKEDTCWQRRTVDNENRVMSDCVIDKLKENLIYIPVQKIRLEAEDVDNKIEKILDGYESESVELYVKNGINNEMAEKFKRICMAKKKDFVLPNERKRDIEELKVEIFFFFYSQYFNPCLGHQVAIDTGGEIKVCLWSDIVLGNIKTDNLKDLIISGVFDEYWEMTKDKIVGCKNCEKRYACNDCRVSSLKEKGSFEEKPGFCNYVP